MLKLIKVKEKWFIGYKDNMQMVPFNASIVVVESVGNSGNKNVKYVNAVWYDYNYDIQSAKRRGILFVRDSENENIAIGTLEYLFYTAELKADIEHGRTIATDISYTGYYPTNNLDTLGFCQDSVGNVKVSSLLYMGSKVWEVIAYENLVNGALLLELSVNT